MLVNLLVPNCHQLVCLLRVDDLLLTILSAESRVSKSKQLKHKITEMRLSAHALTKSEAPAAPQRPPKDQVYGLPLDDLMKKPREKGNAVPELFAALLQRMRATKLIDEGLLRISAGSTQLAELRARIDDGESPAAVLDSPGVSKSMRRSSRRVVV
jgi:hypothetical protein